MAVALAGCLLPPPLLLLLAAPAGVAAGTIAPPGVGAAGGMAEEIQLDTAFREYYRWLSGGPNLTSSGAGAERHDAEEASLRIPLFPPAAIERHSNLTRERFDRLVARGIPFIIEDAADSDWEISSWKCSTFSTEFSGFKFRQEYSPAQKRGDESNLETFGGRAAAASAAGGKKPRAREDKKWWTEKRPNNMKDLPSDAPKYAPFYWDFVKAWDSEPERGWLASGSRAGGGGGGGGGGAAAAQIRQALGRVRGLARLPPGAHAANAAEMRQTLEFWLQPAESGSVAHVDSHCGATIAFTFGGKGVRKRWRLQMLPPWPRPHLDAYTDGVVYTKKEWFPQWEGVTHHGEAIVFYPGMLHEGMNVSPLSGHVDAAAQAGPSEPASAELLDETCVVGMTYQFSRPLAAGLFRHFHERLRRLDELRACRRKVQDLAFFGVEQPLLSNEDQARMGALQRAQELDGDGDGTVSREEAAVYHERSRAGLLPASVTGDEPSAEAGQQQEKKRNRRKRARRVSKSPPRWEDLLHYHDANEDGRIDLQEAASNMRAFSVAEARALEDEATRAGRR